MPNLDIDFWYRLGSQEVWHTECASCGALHDMSDPNGIFPGRSIAFSRGQFPPAAPIGVFVWCCPSCGAWIDDPQRGRYIATNTSVERDPTIFSWLVPRIISPATSADKIMRAFQRSATGDQKKSFFNRTLARPYIDPEQLPVTLEHCLACVADGATLGLQWEKGGKDTYMGIDQMGGFNCIIIKRRLADGRQACVHVEAVWDEEPFDRCAELMTLFGVSVCVAEQLPNVNSARKFCNKFPGRVFLVTAYVQQDDIVTWGDDLTRRDRKTDESERDRYTVHVNQYKAMHVSLYRIRDRMCLFPNPALLEQDMMVEGAPARGPILRDMVFLHFTKTALIVETSAEERKPKAKVVKLGLDPHFSFANMLCDVAWARNNGTGYMMLPSTAAPGTATTETGAKVQQRMPGLPAHIVEMIDSGSRPGTCGSCMAYDPASGSCSERFLNVRANDLSCDLYIGKDT